MSLQPIRAQPLSVNSAPSFSPNINFFQLRSTNLLAQASKKILSCGCSSQMSAAPNRLMLRQARAFGRWSGQRYASTTAQATDAATSTATKSKEAASNATSKASQGLSRVTSTAGPALSGAVQRVSSALGGIGGRTGRLISFVECKWILSHECGSLAPDIAFQRLRSWWGLIRRVSSSCRVDCFGLQPLLQATVQIVDFNSWSDANLEIALIPPAIYYSRVGFELSKIIFRGQRMNPP